MKIRFMSLLLAITCVLFTSVWAQGPSFNSAFDFGSGVQARNGNASPGNGSQIDNYVNQDEQINVTPNDGVVRVLRANQKNVINDYATEAIPVRNVMISEILQPAKAMTAKEGGWAEVFFNTEDKTNHVSVVAPSFQLPYLRDAITKLDVDWLRMFDDGSLQTVYKARNRPASVVGEFADFWAPFGGTTVDSRTNQLVHTNEEVWTHMWHKAAHMIDIPTHEALLDITIYEVDVDTGLRLGLDYIAWKNGPGRTLFDTVITGHQTQSNSQNQSSIYDFLDPLRTQIARETRDAGSNLVNVSANYLLTSAYVDFLATKGKARVVNSSILKVTSGHEAKLSSVADVLAFESPQPGASGFGIDEHEGYVLRIHVGPDGKPERVQVDSEGNPVLSGGNFIPDPNGQFVLEPHESSIRVGKRELEREASSESTGVHLVLHPSIALESMELDVELVENYVSGMNPSTGEPIISELEIHSSVRLADGQPFVLTGLHRKNQAETTAKMPLLGSIPILGYMFGGENNVKAEKMLVAVIVPEFHSLPPNPYKYYDDHHGHDDHHGDDHHGDDHHGDHHGSHGLPEWAETIKHQAHGDQEIDLPESSLGFDQWLLDGETL